VTSNVLSEKGFRQQHDTVTLTAKILIAKIRKHIEEDRCRCCREALEEALENV
jgi:hypothetical protein